MQSIQGLIKANGTFNLQAGHDLTMVGGALQNTGKGATTLSAGNDIMLMADERGSHVLQDPNAPFDPNNYTKSGTYDQTGGTIDVGGSLSLTAGRDIFAQGTQVNAAGAIKLKADRDVSIITALKGTEFESKSQYTSSSMWGLGKTITTTSVTNTHLRNTLSSWNGASFSARAGRDLTLQGTQVNAGGIDLRAGNDLNVLAVYDVDEMSHTKSVVNKGLAKLLGQDSSDNYCNIRMCRRRV